MAERLAKKNTIAVKKVKEAGEASRKDPQITEEAKVKHLKVDAIPTRGAQRSKLPSSSPKIEEVCHHLAVQGRKVFGGKSAEEMAEFLNVASEWGMSFTILAQYFVGATRDLAALLKKTNEFHWVAAKLEVDELKLQDVLGQVKLLTEERDKLNISVSELIQ
ncbi:M48 family peptidase [Sesbania bispinosa]|nr:M48 family peptidase [Sesbania bispinosa]